MLNGRPRKESDENWINIEEMDLDTNGVPLSHKESEIEITQDESPQHQNTLKPTPVDTDVAKQKASAPPPLTVTVTPVEPEKKAVESVVTTAELTTGPIQRHAVISKTPETETSVVIHIQEQASENTSNPATAENESACCDPVTRCLRNCFATLFSRQKKLSRKHSDTKAEIQQQIERYAP